MRVPIMESGIWRVFLYLFAGCDCLIVWLLVGMVYRKAGSGVDYSGFTLIVGNGVSGIFGLLLYYWDSKTDVSFLCHAFLGFCFSVDVW